MLTDLVRLWNRAAPWFPLTETFLSRMAFEVVLERQGDTVTGFALYGGYHLQLLAVDPCHHGKGVGRRLLAEVGRRMRASGHRAVILGMGVKHVFPGSPSVAHGFFEHMGFSTASEVWDMRATAAQIVLPAVDRSLMAVIGPVEESEEAAALIKRTFGHVPEGLAIGLVDGDAVVGAAMLHPPGSTDAQRWAGGNPAIASLGHVAVKYDRRREGLGLATVVRGLEVLIERGAADVVIDCTTLLGFYGKCGFRPWLSYRSSSMPL